MRASQRAVAGTWSIKTSWAKGHLGPCNATSSLPLGSFAYCHYNWNSAVVPAPHAERRPEIAAARCIGSCCAAAVLEPLPGWSYTFGNRLLLLLNSQIPAKKISRWEESGITSWIVRRSVSRLQLSWVGCVPLRSFGCTCNDDVLKPFEATENCANYCKLWCNGPSTMIQAKPGGVMQQTFLGPDGNRWRTRNQYITWVKQRPKDSASAIQRTFYFLFGIECHDCHQHSLIIVDWPMALKFACNILQPAIPQCDILLRLLEKTFNKDSFFQ